MPRSTFVRRVRFGNSCPSPAIIKNGGKWIMKVLVTGVKGQLGHDVMDELALRGIEGFGVDVEEMDITDRTACETVISQEKPDAVIHCAAYTAVDAAEDNLELCRKINAEGTRNIARVCKAMDIKMMYISTDYVFNGGGERPWEPDDHREPLNVYGLTKYEGEIAVEQNVQKYFIVRIAWVFGVNGKNFIKTMLRLGKEKGAVSVVNDQIGSPTYTYDLARLLVDMIQTDKYGRYHATNEGLCSWYEFACEIFRQAGMDEVKVTPVDSDGFPAKAKRPSNSRMSKEKLTENGFERLPSWQNALERYLKALKDNGMA
ncbi:dTDP-4-dehydrorhamnose reductase [Enterocloster bolteae]|uniref:dTDP-4-dehydrorhamnose reductase n=3 Tax=Enterocloster bolteae TaxID=208479 RepID=R0B9Y4_9FIRM|nr:dTDP-4-dehydrorhamnose reductase [Enterocloster bolteae]ENZ45513.1 dTDP-4-dehydrorhamnose reductase [Enterocloster bolteae 90B8]ENZ54052.1 dTDP-4-dehydrorhamnose reductase [Enterocloster bolteae 90A5]ENZ69243.1 dTDP-4-dehydrorhamnose reductase [Enterocloster bolteae 90B7]KMW13607.1 dTDP-4-dehydrorhamnose reductase [Enterocloster bolteae WAL-14578]MBS6094429.1 dTDP-4-dehydrorhamnose reductase [Enterocloster bolteae]